MAGHQIGTHTDALVHEAEGRAEAAERRAAALLGERDRLTIEIKAQAAAIANLQEALRRAEARAAAAAGARPDSPPCIGSRQWARLLKAL